MAESGESFVVECGCGKKMKASTASIGKKAKCPGCGRLITLNPPAKRAVSNAPTAAKPAARAAAPAPQLKPEPAARTAPRPSAPKVSVPAKAPPPKPEPAHDDGLDALYELAETEQKASQNQSENAGPVCPSCMSPLAPGAVLCVNCGYNTKTAKKVGATTVAKVEEPKRGFFAKSSKPGEDKMAPQGSLINGVLMCAAFAAAAGLLWGLVVKWIGWDIYFLTIVIGGAAGVGMQIGQKGFSTLGGIIAAAMTLVTFVLARIIVFYVVIMGGGGDEDASAASESHDFDDRVVYRLTEDQLKANGHADPDNASEEAEATAEKAAIAKLKAMPEHEYKTLLARVNLVDYVANEKVSKTSMDRSNFSAYAKARRAIEDEARAEVDKMTPEQVATELKKHEDAEKAADAAAEKNAKESGESSGSGTATAIGIAVLFFFIIGIKPAIFLLLSMGLAYKTAAGAVSD